MQKNNIKLNRYKYNSSILIIMTTIIKYMNDMEQLQDIIDFIEPENEINTNIDQILDTCFELIDYYISLNPSAISEPNF